MRLYPESERAQQLRTRTAYARIVNGLLVSIGSPGIPAPGGKWAVQPTQRSPDRSAIPMRESGINASRQLSKHHFRSLSSSSS